MQQRFAPLFAIGISLACLLLVFMILWFIEAKAMETIAGALLTLLGTIIGFYFGGRQAK